MVKLLATISILLFTGCSTIQYSDVRKAYVDTKVVYQDAKYILHEIQDEVNATKHEFKK